VERERERKEDQELGSFENEGEMQEGEKKRGRKFYPPVHTIHPVVTLGELCALLSRAA